MDTETPMIVRAVLDGNVEKLNECLAQGASPNHIWGTLPLVTHAALLPSLAIFQSLIDHGANVPENFLCDVITWELGDWRIHSKEDEEQLVEILEMVRSTSAWLPADRRRELVERLAGYKLPTLVAALLRDST